MKKVAKGCLITLLVLCVGIGVALLITALTRGNNDTTVETEESGVKLTTDVTTVTNIKGIKFKVPANWVISDTKFSQSILYHSMSDYHKEGLNAISITSSWVENDFDIKGYVDTFCDALGESSTVASAKRENFKINGYDIEAVSVVNNGAFGGYCYLVKDNVIIEILYGTENPDDLDKYSDEVNDIIASIEFTGDVKKEDFPEPSEEPIEYSGELPKDINSEESSKSGVHTDITESTETSEESSEELEKVASDSTNESNVTENS